MSRRKRVCFLPDDFRQRQVQRRTNKLCAAMFLLVMAVLGFTIGGTEYSLLRVAVEHDRVEKQYAQAAVRIEQIGQLQATQNRLAHQAQVLADLLQKVPRSYMVAEVTNALPAEVTLVNLELSSETPTSTQKRDKSDDVSLRLTGLAGSDVQISLFVNQLSRSTVLRDVNLLSTIDHPQTPTESRRFIIGLTPDARATLPPAGPVLSSTAVELSPE